MHDYVESFKYFVYIMSIQPRRKLVLAIGVLVLRNIYSYAKASKQCNKIICNLISHEMQEEEVVMKHENSTTTSAFTARSWKFLLYQPVYRVLLCGKTGRLEFKSRPGYVTFIKRHRIIVE